MIGREELTIEQSREMVVQALREVLLEPEFKVPDGEDPSLAKDLDIDDVTMGDFIVALEREFEVGVPEEAAEGWSAFDEVVSGMKTIHNERADDEAGPYSS